MRRRVLDESPCETVGKKLFSREKVVVAAALLATSDQFQGKSYCSLSRDLPSLDLRGS